MSESLFPYDVAFEQVMASYLDHHLYFNPLFSEHHRVTDADLQNKGVDVILTSNEFGLVSSKVDEKCAAHHCNEDMQTFAFELYYKKKEVEHIGWFIDPSKETQAYMLVWPFVKSSLGRGYIKSIKEEDITGVRYLIVKREKLAAYFNKRGFSYERLLSEAKTIFTNPSTQIDTNYSQFHYSKSPKYAESPVNLVVKREILWKLADLKGDVVGNIMTPIKGW